jgi:pyruvate formate lyase activating enzyme
MDIYGRVHSFESCGTVDGPGVRFVVFMQGCLLRCQYCHNPDTWDLNGGSLFTAPQVMEKIKRYIPYLKATGGGVTVTGGEPLLQIEFLSLLFMLCKKSGLHTAIDTSGSVSVNNPCLDTLMEYTDLVLLDIKHINPIAHKEITGHSNYPTLEFARYLDRKSIPVWIRYVMVPDLTDDPDSLYELNSFIKSLSNVKNIEILPYHRMGVQKWENLNIDYKLHKTRIPSEDEIQKVKNLLCP